MSYWNSQAKRRVINCGNRIGNWKRLGGIVIDGCKSVSTIFPLIRIQYEAERKTSGFKVMRDIFISKGFGFVEAVLLNKVYFMFTVKKIILLTKAKYIFDYSLRLRNCVLFALLWVSFIVCHQDCRFSSILCQVGFIVLF